MSEWEIARESRVDLYAKLSPGQRYELVAETDGIAVWEIAQGDRLLNDANCTALWDSLLEENDYR